MVLRSFQAQKSLFFPVILFLGLSLLQYVSSLLIYSLFEWRATFRNLDVFLFLQGFRMWVKKERKKWSLIARAPWFFKIVLNLLSI